MNSIKNVKDGVNSLLNKNNISVKSSWDFIEKESTDITDKVILNGLTYPLFYWRNDPQIEAVSRNAIKNIGGSISLKIYGSVSKDYGLDAFIYKALDISEWVLDSKIKKITSYINKNAANITLLMENGKVALLELGASLAIGTPEEVNYTAWGKEGLESTKVISTMIRPQSIYLFTDSKTPYEYNDAIIELYGLSLGDATKAVSIFKAITNEIDLEYYALRDKKLKFYISKVYESDKTNSSVLI